MHDEMMDSTPEEVFGEEEERSYCPATGASAILGQGEVYAIEPAEHRRCVSEEGG
jgi:hypothetical protein